MDGNIERQHFLERIEVQPPYFALENFKQVNADSPLEAIVPVQHALGFEEGIISAAEAGRHLAILGSCSLSLINPQNGKFFYLAHQAEYRSMCCESGREPLVGRAESKFLDKRSAEAKTQITDSVGKLVCTLEIRYHVFSERVFRKLFSRHELIAKESLEDSVNPYSEIPPLSKVYFSDNKVFLCGNLDILRAKNCVGHFPGFPAMPVAILAHYLIYLAGLYLRNLMNLENLRYRVRDVDLVAPNLGFANEAVFFKVEFLKSEAGAFHFYGTARTGEQKEIGALKIVLIALS